MKSKPISDLLLKNSNELKVKKKDEKFERKYFLAFNSTWDGIRWDHNETIKFLHGPIDMVCKKQMISFSVSRGLAYN